MTPILYEKDEIDFTSQGLGSLVEIYDVEVEEQRNGLLQLTASYPVSGARYDDISVGRIILAKPNQRDDVHAFRIVNTELDISGYALMIEADSITYDLTHNLVKHLVASGNGQSFMTALKNAVINPSIFSFYSDIATSSTTSLDYVNPMEAIMGTTGSFLQIWGGELKRENRRVAMFNRRGRDNVSTFRLGKNISGLKYSVDISSLVTRIIPTKSVQNDDQTTTTLEGTPVDSQYINNYEQIYTLPLEFTDDAIKTVADLNAAAKGWFTQSANTGRDKPTVTIDIDVLSLQDSADYQDKFKNLESVSLTDTVTVYVPEYGVNVTAIVNELHYDPILDRVTKMTVGTAKQSFADNSRTQLSDLQDKIISVQNQADAAAVSADGKSTNYYGSVEPSHPQEGDTWFWVNGDKSGVKVFVNGEWVEPVDSDTQEKIANAVTEAVTQAQTNTAEAIEQNNVSQQEVMNDIAKSQADLAIKDGDFNNKAQDMADKALSDAKANDTIVAQETLDNANANIDAAKESLTTDLQKEVSDRTTAVAALDTKAKGYADDVKNSLGDEIAKEVSDRQEQVSGLDTKAQDYANTAKTDALNALTEEVTNRQNAVSALDTKATNAINQAKSDITDTINAISVGGRNYILDTANPKTQTSNGNDNQDLYDKAIFYKSLDQWAKTDTKYKISFDWNLKTVLTNDMLLTLVINQSPWQNFTVTIPANKLSGHADITFILWSSTISAKPTGITFRINSQMASGNTITYSNLFMKSGTISTDWTPAPEDVVLDYTTKDNQIKTTISQYQTTNDEKVSKVQTDATTALGLVATKVSQTDYDTKTGDLTTKYTQVKQTTDSQATDIVDIKETATSQASKINSISSDVDGTKQSISDIETTQDSQSDKINQITTDVDGTKQSITDIQTKDGKQDTRMGTIETSVSGVKSDFSSYKTTNDGVVKTAQTTAQTAVDGLKNKVSQTDYNAKTGQLQTDLTTTTQTANQAKTDIVSIKQKDGDQDARMTQIESDASGVKTTVSDLKTAQGKQSGDISTLQQRADGFDATVTKVNNLSTGDRNYILDTGTPKTQTLNGEGNQDFFDSAVFYEPLKNWGVVNTDYIISFDWVLKDVFSSDTTIGVLFNQYPWQPNFKTIPANQKNGHIEINFKLWAGMLTTTNDVTGLTFRINSQMASENQITYSNLFMKSGNISNNWTPAPEDGKQATAKAQLTADQATLSINNYKADADGRISKAQSDITQTANQVATKVSQTDYDQTTGDLSAKYNSVKQTVDEQSSKIAAINETNDSQTSKINSVVSDVDGTKQSISDIETTQDSQSAKINQITSDVDGTKQSITDIQTKDGDQDTRMGTIETSVSGVKSEFSNYKTDANGRISTAQTTAQTAVDGLMSKVSQSDYNTKTGDLDTRVTKAQTTADGAMTTVGAYKTSNDNRVSAAETKISQNANDIVLRATKTDLDGAKSDYTAKISQINVNYDGISQTVSQVNDKVNDLSQNNLINNSDFVPDLDGWYLTGNGTYSNGDYDYSGAVLVVANTGGGIVNLYSTAIPINNAQSVTVSWCLNYYIFSVGSDGNSYVYIQYLDSDKNQIPNYYIGAVDVSGNSGGWKQHVINNCVLTNIPSEAKYIRLVVDARNQGTRIGINKPMLVKSTQVGAYVAGKYNSNGKVAAQQITIDGISNIVSDPNTGLSTRIQTAEGTLNTVKSTADGAMSKANQTANDITQEIRDRNDGDSNTLQSSKDFTQSSITSTVNGVNSTITQTSDSLITKINTKTDSDTVLSLLKNNWSIGISDNIGNITSGIVGNSDSMSLISDNITLDGNTTVTGDFYAKGGNFTNLNASNINVGTLNGNQVNITNLNASNIVSGAISGANLNINLNTGSVVFQKGRINSSDYTTDINIDQGYISTANGDTRVILKNGQLQLTSPNYYDLQTNPYLSISNNPRTFDSTGQWMYSAVISARDRVVIGNKDGISSMLGDTYYIGQSSFYGLSSGKTIGSKIPTVVGGGATGVVLVGGSTYTNTIGGNDSPSIVVGWSSGGSTFSGNRVRINADYFHVGAVYNRTSSASSNVVVAADGAIVRSSSARKYKLDIKNDISIAESLKLIEVPLSTWVDKHEHEENGSNERYFGMIAEDLRDAGLEYLVQYGEDNEVEGINYDRVALLLIPLVKELKERIEELESEGK